MRILLINKFHWHRDGAANVYLGTAKLLNELGHDTAFFAMSHPNNIPSRWSKYFVPQVDYNDYKQGLINNIKIGLSSIWNLKAQKNLEKLIKDFKPDVAHLHVIYHQLTPAIIHTLKKHKIPVVMTHHDFKMISPAYNLEVRGNIYEETKTHKDWRFFLDKGLKDSYSKSLISVIESYVHKIARSYHRVNVHISPSRFLKHKFREFGMQDRIEVINNPYLGNTETGDLNDNNYFLSMGRISREKGLATMLKAFAQTKSKETKMYIAGTGPYLNKLKKLVFELELEAKVEFLGHLNQRQMTDVLSKARAVIVPSACYENFSMSIVEATWCGKPVIATDIGGNPEIIEDGINGYIVPSGDVKEMSKKMQTLIDQQDIIEHLGREAQKRSRLRYDKNDYIQKIIKIYEELIQKY